MVDVFIVGCGIVGACAAYELTKDKNLRVVLADRENAVSYTHLSVFVGVEQVGFLLYFN